MSSLWFSFTMAGTSCRPVICAARRLSSYYLIAATMLVHDYRLDEAKLPDRVRHFLEVLPREALSRLSRIRSNILRRYALKSH